MATAHDVASYILQKQGKMTTMKLQKLVYYTQAWSLVWDEKPLFKNRIEAWANGPVVPDLYNVHRGKFAMSSWPKGDRDRLNKSERETVDAVLAYYGTKSSQWLSALTHQEAPWRDAREGVAPGDFCDAEISQASMAEYYGGLV
jgi:uncharacterized phage-associated protein